MRYMFARATSFQGLGISNWDVSRVTDMCSMFHGVTVVMLCVCVCVYSGGLVVGVVCVYGGGGVCVFVCCV